MELIGWVIASVLVAATIGIHYEIMRLVSDVILPWALKRFHDRRVVVLMIASLMLGHIAEIWAFAFGMMAVSRWPELGSLSGAFNGSLSAFLYFSSVNYTSLGYGDITPHGAMRAIAVSETLAGLLMIAWSASFTYLKMEKIWDLRQRSGK
ncbi:MAG TPA: potassium channel family protein [Alphaproteobacteria bacterium]|nr:potassium channel family protein [Alphaproteobacteria bacterium]